MNARLLFGEGRRGATHLRSRYEPSSILADVVRITSNANQTLESRIQIHQHK